MFGCSRIRNIQIAGVLPLMSLIGFNLSAAISEAAIQKKNTKSALQYQIEYRSRAQIFLLYRHHCMCFRACPRSASSHSVDKSAPRMLDLQRYLGLFFHLCYDKKRIKIALSTFQPAGFKSGIGTYPWTTRSAKNQIAIRSRRYLHYRLQTKYDIIYIYIYIFMFLGKTLENLGAGSRNAPFRQCRF